MDQCEDREEGVPPSKTTLCGEHESQTKAQRNQPEPEPEPDPEPEPEPSCVSFEIIQSKDMIMTFKEGRSPPAESSQSSSLRELDLRNNDLKDSRVKVLSSGIQHRLSGCLITEEGCKSLFSALSSNPSHLRELDLSYNHPGEAGVKLLKQLRLETLRMEPDELRWLRAEDLRKYSYQLTIDTNTVYTDLKLSDNNRKVTHVVEDQSYPDHPDRFERWPQLLCRDGLTGRCYWEVEWSGEVLISVSYRRISRKGDSDDCVFGHSGHSWSLTCSDMFGYKAWHSKTKTSISSSPSSSSVSNRVAVYVDCPAGTLSFYRVSSDTLIHLHTFNTTFTEPLYPGFGLWFRPSRVTSGCKSALQHTFRKTDGFFTSSVSLCWL